MNNESINQYLSPNAPSWLKTLVATMKQANTTESTTRRVDEGFRAHILERDSDEERRPLLAFEKGEEAVQENEARAKLKQKLLAEVSKKEPKFFSR
jgi:hypothetical protein